MKRIRADSTGVVFQLDKREGEMLVQLLKLYPVIPASYPKLHQTSDSPVLVESQRLLEESLAELRSIHQQQIQSLLQAGTWLNKVPAGYHLTLTGTQREWLLQVLNDVRVGCWIQLGCPDDLDSGNVGTDARQAIFTWALHLCGFFQFRLVGD